MSVDLLIGLIIGLTGSVLTLMGTIITNRQNNKHQLSVIEGNHNHEKEILVKKYALENSFKEYELTTRMVERMIETDGRTFKIYPYDMYILIYNKIADHINNDGGEEELHKLLLEMKAIREKYEFISPNSEDTE